MTAYAVTEPNAGSDAAAIQTKAKRVGDEYVLSGTKQFITNASIANFYIVFAVTDRAAEHKGISAFIVERDWPGVEPGRKDDKMGQRASNTAQLILEEVRVPKQNLLGREGDAFKIADMAMQIQAARWLCWHAAWLADQGRRSSREASMAKCFGADVAVQVTSEAVQIFGGYGYVKDYVVEKLYRDAKVFQIYEGTSEIQRTIIARDVLQGSAH